MGLDVSLTPNFNEVLMGIPGYYDWAGSVIRHQSGMVQSTEGRRRRDTDAPPINVPTYASQIVNYFDSYPFRNESYFGYSISTGYYDSEQPHKVLYLSTAPQADRQNGQSYIFDILSTGAIYYVDIKKIFDGSQFGEYFGYKVVSEDINGDNKPDVIISAPMYYEKNYDVGAIYVFVNEGHMQFSKIKVVSPSKKTGRFGTTISKLGDINNDGYNDIAVGAPFEDDGVVYIFLGSPSGLRSKPSQIIKGQKSANKIYGNGNMFGHGLSQGSDIDNNGFNDFAVGAPNADAVFLYKAYPVIQPILRIDSAKEVHAGVSNVDVKMCYRIKFLSKNIQNQPLKLTMTVDPTLKRATFTENNSHEIHKEVTGTSSEVCESHKISITENSKEIFKPIEVSVSFEIVNKIPKTDSKFCETCVVSDPDISNKVIHKISYSTGCSGICNADLKIKTVGAKDSIIVGQTKSLTMTYEVSNTGETAFDPQIKFNSNTRFNKVPKNCQLNRNEKLGVNELACSFGNGFSFPKGGKEEISVVLDTSDIKNISKMVISANATSSGNELTPKDNFVENVIIVKRENNVAVTGTNDPSNDNFNLEKFKDTVKVKNVFEVSLLKLVYRLILIK